MYRSLLTLVACVLLIALSSCAPRGESKSLSEVFEAAKTRYTTARSGAQGIAELQSLESTLSSWVSKPSYDGARKISDTLRTLIVKTGYTSRPAMGELIEQYQTIGFDKSAMKISPSRVKLLVARTYNLLASELETTAFRVS